MEGPEYHGVVKVTPDRLKVIIALGVSDEDRRAEDLESSLDMEVDDALGALDGLIEAGVVEDKDAELFRLTSYGMELFTAIYEGVSAVS